MLHREASDALCRSRDPWGIEGLGDLVNIIHTIMDRGGGDEGGGGDGAMGLGLSPIKTFGASGAVGGYHSLCWPNMLSTSLIHCKRQNSSQPHLMILGSGVAPHSRHSPPERKNGKGKRTA